MIEKHAAIEMSYGIPGMLWPSEAAWLYDNIRISRRHVEVGTYCGRSALLCAGGMKQGSTIICVDNFSITPVTANWTRKVFHATKMVVEHNTGAKLELIENNSIEAFRMVAGRGVTFDSVFIDADHNYAECKADIEMWSTLVRTGGLVCGHDYWPVDSGVMEAVNETGPFEVVPATRIWFRRKH